MLDVIMCVAAIWGLTFALKEMDGPFNIINKARRWLWNNQHVGVFFYQLLGCYFCLGAWTGVIIYTLHQHFQDMNLFDMVIWGLAGSTISWVGDILISKWRVS